MAFSKAKPLPWRSWISVTLGRAVAWRYPTVKTSFGRTLPREMGLRQLHKLLARLRDRQAADVWEQLHEALRAGWGAADQIDWSRVIVDSST